MSSQKGSVRVPAGQTRRVPERLGALHPRWQCPTVLSDLESMPCPPRGTPKAAGW